MRLDCALRQARGKRTLRDIEKTTGINRGYLSDFERGRRLPTDAQVPILEREYGLRRDQFYSATAPFGMTCAIVPDEEER